MNRKSFLLTALLAPLAALFGVKAEPSRALCPLPDTGTVHKVSGSCPVPPGYLQPDGRLISRDDYPELFAAIGTTYGTEKSRTMFRLPDYRGRLGQWIIKA